MAASMTRDETAYRSSDPTDRVPNPGSKIVFDDIQGVADNRIPGNDSARHGDTIDDRVRRRRVPGRTWHIGKGVP